MANVLSQKRRHRVFHKHGPAMLKLLSPKMVYDCGIIRVLSDADKKTTTAVGDKVDVIIQMGKGIGCIKYEHTSM